MIECSNCETPQFLQITASRMRYDSGSGIVHKFAERYECTLCGSTGEMRTDTETTRLDGNVCICESEGVRPEVPG